MENIIKNINGKPFENDDSIIGKWENIGSIDKNAGSKIDNLQLSRENFSIMYCLPQGEKYWIFEGWTKGVIFIHYGGEDPILECPYEICNIDKTDYMFVKVLSDVEYNYEVFKRVDNKKYELREIGRHDNTNLEFIYDAEIVGEWETIGFVDRIEEFEFETTGQSLYLESIIFNPDGSAKQKYFDEDAWDDKWTKEYLINVHRETVSHYQIKKIGEVEYLFLEWKMGDYIYGGAEPSYYVLKRKQ